MAIQAPRVRKGDAITAGWANQVADAINQGLRSPRDVVGGDAVPQQYVVDTEIATDDYEYAISRITRTTRFENPDDPDLYVDVVEPVSIIFRRSDGTLVGRDYGG